MKILLSRLLELSRRTNLDEAIRNRTWNVSDVPFADTIGFHLYCDLEMRLGSSTDDEVAAARTLEILQTYAWAADSVCESGGLRILEIQGQRLHFLLETQDVSATSLENFLHSCRVFYGLASKEIKRIVGEVPFTIRMAADYGRAILLPSNGDDISESIVSLGNCANRPAKHLSRAVMDNGVPAGYLAMNIAALTDPNENANWELINLEVSSATKAADEKDNLDEAIKNRFQQMMSFSAKGFEENPKNPVNLPIRRIGFMFRADLDGFSLRVQQALAQGDEAIRALVLSFHQIMKYPVAFKDELPEGVSVVCFPWAGDCANLFLQCDNYALERTHLPSTASLKWHRPKVNGTDWKGIFGETRWVAAIAGGDDEADHGSILTGNVTADGRTFHVGAGWSVRRSLQAEQSKGTKPSDTVIQKEDHGALDENLKDAYRDHPQNPTLFKIAPLGALVQCDKAEQSAAAISAPAILPSREVKIARPKPYATVE